VKLQTMDIVRRVGSTWDVGLIKEISNGDASVQWILGSRTTQVAWFSEDELEVVDSLPYLLARSADYHSTSRKHNEELWGKRFNTKD
jgi:hypothetical protein